MDPLRNAVTLNEAVRQADEQTCRRLLEREQKDKRRPSFILRIHSRLNRLRAHREREELLRSVR